jgi:MoxR-like ATPase
VLTGSDLDRLQRAVREVRLEPSVLDYALHVVRKTRASRHLTLGASPRGSVALCRASQAHAFLAGRDYVLPDDVKALSVPVLAHRVLGPNLDAESGVDERERVIADLVESVEVPL